MLKGAVNNLLDCDHGGDDDVIDNNHDDVGGNGDENVYRNDEGEHGVRAQGCCEE